MKERTAKTAARSDAIKKKLRGNAGESITETLIALLISVLALVMLAGAITAAANVITKSRTRLAAYYAGEDALVNGEGGNAGTVKITGGGLPEESFAVTCQVNDEFGRTPVISYKYSDPGEPDPEEPSGP